MTDEKPEETSDKIDPWTRIQDVVKKAVGEEFSKWEISQNDSQPSEKKETDPLPSDPSSSPKPERKKGFLENFFGIQN